MYVRSSAPRGRDPARTQGSPVGAPEPRGPAHSLLRLIARFIPRLVLAFCLPLVLAVALVRGAEPAFDLPSPMERELSKMREATVRLHEEGDKLWNPVKGRRDDGKLWNTAGGHGQEDGGPAQTDSRTREEAPPEDPKARSAARHEAEQHRAQEEAANIQRIVRAAEQGDARAQCILGTMYATGQGMPKNDAKAAQLYAQAAGQNNADAQYALGWMYAHGRGVPRDEAKAVQWCLKAAEQGGGVSRASCQNLRRSAK